MWSRDRLQIKKLNTSGREGLNTYGSRRDHPIVDGVSYWLHAVASPEFQDPSPALGILHLNTALLLSNVRQPSHSLLRGTL